VSLYSAVLPVEDSNDEGSSDFIDNIIFIALIATFVAVGIIVTAIVVAVYCKVRSKKRKAVIR